MLKKMTGNKVRKEKMETIKGSGGNEPIFAIYANWCDCYCAEHCGTKPGMTEAQHEGQYEYRE